MLTFRRWLFHPVLVVLDIYHESNRAYLRNLHRKVDRIMTDLTQLETKVDALTAKVTETATTLGGLKAEIIKLRDALPPDQQAAVDAITAKLDAALATLGAAEDDADDVLATTGAEPQPTPGEGSGTEQ